MAEAPDRTARWVGPGVLLVFLTALVSGVSTFVNAYAIHGTSSDAFVTIRNITVAAFLVPLAILGGRGLSARLRRIDWARLAVIGLVGGAVPFLLFFRGVQLATVGGGAATASFGYRTLFLMAAVLALVFLRERLNARWFAAAALLLGGNALLLALTSPIWTDGTAYVLAATALWAAEYTLSKRTLRDLPSGTVGLGRMGFGAVFLSGYLALTGQWGSVAGFSSAQWEWVAISALLLTAFVATWYAGLKRVDLGAATSVLVLGFPVTWALGLAVKGGSLPLPAAAGAALVVVGAVLAVGLASLRATATFLAEALGRRTPSAG